MPMNYADLRKIIGDYLNAHWVTRSPRHTYKLEPCKTWHCECKCQRRRRRGKPPNCFHVLLLLKLQLRPWHEFMSAPHIDHTVEPWNLQSILEDEMMRLENSVNKYDAPASELETVLRKEL